MKPLINDESHEEAQSLDSPKVKFNESDSQAENQFPLESRLKYVLSCHVFYLLIVIIFLFALDITIF